MNFNKDSKLTDILAAYPWLPGELVKIDARLKFLQSPIGKMMIKGMTVAQASEKVNIPEEEILSRLRQMIDEHKG